MAALPTAWLTASRKLWVQRHAVCLAQFESKAVGDPAPAKWLELTHRATAQVKVRDAQIALAMPASKVAQLDGVPWPRGC